MNLTEKDLSISRAEVNKRMLPFAFATLMLLVLVLLVHGKMSFLQGLKDFFSWKIFIPVLVIGIMVHELIHGITWAFFSPAKWRDISFGFQLKTLTPYAHCKVPMKLPYYKLGAIMPGLLLGILPYFYGMFSGNTAIAIGGFLFTFVACGDFWILYSLRNEPPSAMVKDHPVNAGCIVYYAEKSVKKD